MMINKKLRKVKSGFTLIEILIVLGVIGVLIGILFGSLGENKRTIDEDTVKIKMQSARFQIEAAIQRFQNHFGRFPTTDEGLFVLLEPSPETQDRYPDRPFVGSKNSLLDPWNQIYQYKLDEDTGQYQVFTFGSDRKEGGDGPARDRNLANIK